MFRNIAIIAHVDHGKTTLVDEMLNQCHAFQAHEKRIDRVLDSMDLERERGITITSKNTAIRYQGCKINILDTPGHADFGGEVERVLSMVEGAILLVDASEGPLPQTRFVLRKAMEAGLQLIICINKIDRPDARIDEVLQEVYDLFIDLDANEDDLEFPVLYSCARQGIASESRDEPGQDLRPLLDMILAKIPPPALPDGPPQLLVTNLDRDPYVGRLALGRLCGNTLGRGDMVTWFGESESRRVRAQLIYSWEGLKRLEVDRAEAGDIIALAGIEGITVGDSIVGGASPVPLERITVDEPTIGMLFSINTSPQAGVDGRFVTGRQIRDRLDRELLSNVSLQLVETDNQEAFMVYGRGELQLSILVEQMRREGFELTLSRPMVVRKEVDGQKLEPWERLQIDVPDVFIGAITTNLANRKGQLQDMVADGNGRTEVVYLVPSRGLIGFRNEMLTQTHGEAVMNTNFSGWQKDAGFIRQRSNGALVSDRAGKATGYSLYHLQPRGQLFIGAQTEVYEGMIIGEHKRDNDLNVNVVKGKQLTNIRSANADEKLILSTPRLMSLESAIEWIDDDEYVEVTPKVVRLRKKVLPANKRTIRRNESRLKIKNYTF